MLNLRTGLTGFWKEPDRVCVPTVVGLRLYHTLASKEWRSVGTVELAETSGVEKLLVGKPPSSNPPYA